MIRRITMIEFNSFCIYDLHSRIIKQNIENVLLNKSGLKDDFNVCRACDIVSRMIALRIVWSCLELHESSLEEIIKEILQFEGVPELIRTIGFDDESTIVHYLNPVYQDIVREKYN